MRNTCFKEGKFRVSQTEGGNTCVVSSGYVTATVSLFALETLPLIHAKNERNISPRNVSSMTEVKTTTNLRPEDRCSWSKSGQTVGSEGNQFLPEIWAWPRRFPSWCTPASPHTTSVPRWFCSSCPPTGSKQKDTPLYHQWSPHTSRYHQCIWSSDTGSSSQRWTVSAASSL